MVLDADNPRWAALDEIVNQVLDSVELAMKSEGIDEETREIILDTVEDAVANHADELLPYCHPDGGSDT